MDNVKTHKLLATIILFSTNRKCFSDLTGAFPHKSIRGNFYVIVVYDFEINAIISEPIKTRQAPTICDKFLKMHKILKSRGKNPK